MTKKLTIEVYTDGSFNRKALNDDVCCGTGIVTRIFSYNPNIELENEEYTANRYSSSDIINMLQSIGINISTNNITSTLIECIAFKDGLDKISKYIYDDVNIRFYVDDSITMKLVNTYIQIKLNGGDVTKSRRYGFYFMLLSKFLPFNNDILKRIKIYHISAHKNYYQNNMADRLASYKSSPFNKIFNCLSYNNKINNKKEYYLTINDIIKNMLK